MKKTLSILTAAILVTGLFLTGAAQAAKTIQIGHVNPSKDDDQYHKCGTLFGKYVEELSGGKIVVDVIADSQLGGEREMMEGMQTGVVDGSVMTNLSIGLFEPKFHIFNLPYLFATRAQAYAILDDPEVMDDLKKTLYENHQIKFLAWGEGGYRHAIENVRPINTPEDFKGIKFRLAETPIYVDTFRALGANPTTMAFSETFTAVQQKTVDGLELPIISIRTAGYYEVCKYLSLTAHFYSPISICVARSVWDGLSQEEQGWLQEAANRMSGEQRTFVQGIEQQFIEEMTKAGLQVNDVKDKAAFRAAVQPVYDKYQKEIGADLIKLVETKLKAMQ